MIHSFYWGVWIPLAKNNLKIQVEQRVCVCVCVVCKWWWVYGGHGPGLLV